MSVQKKQDYVIRTERLGLRFWKPEDLEPFAKMNSDPEVMKYFPAPMTMKESKEALDRIVSHFSNYRYGLFVLEMLEDRRFIGFTGFNRPAFESYFTPCVEIGWRLIIEAWGKGYATEAAAACLEYGFDALRFREVYSFTSVLNKSSERVMQKIGMEKEGEFDHPKIEQGHPLRKHVLYKISTEY